MKKSFNLCNKKWIPTILIDGRQSLASLRDIFANEQSIVDIAVSPIERIALFRLFSTITYGAFRLTDWPEDNRELEEQISSKVNDYLNQWEDSFDLWHDKKPFMQIANIANSSQKDKPSTNKLDPSLASGGNSNIFDSDSYDKQPRAIPQEKLAISLLTHLCFAAGGATSKVIWNGAKSSDSAKITPCLTSSLWHMLIVRKTLLKSIIANLPEPEDLYDQGWNKHKVDDKSASWGVPSWEIIPKSFDDKESEYNTARTFLGRLIPYSRIILLDHDGKRLALGNLFAAVLTDEVPNEHLGIVMKTKESFKYYSCKDSESPWRTLPAIIASRKKNSEGGPITLANIDGNEPVDIWLGGLHAKQANIIAIKESRLKLPAGVKSEQAQNLYNHGLLIVNDKQKQLERAVRAYAEKLAWQGAKSPQMKRIKNLPYEMLQQKLNKLMDFATATTANEIEEAQKVWERTVHNVAIEAFNITCTKNSPRELMAYNTGISKLTTKKKAVKK